MPCLFSCCSTKESGPNADSGIAKKYTFGKTLGSGAFSVAKVGIPHDGSYHKAIKILRKTNANYDEKAVKKEVQIMKKIDHTACIKLHEVFDEQDAFYLVLDLVVGGELFDRLAAKHHLSEKDAAHIVHDAMNAIDYLHSIGIVHRDLKPENFLFASNIPTSPGYDVIKLCDFGAAAEVRDASEASIMDVIGSPEYVAPEVVELMEDLRDGRHPRGYGASVDVWSMGVVFYVMLAGTNPFFQWGSEQAQPDVIWRKAKAAEFSFPSPAWDGISDGAKDLIRKMIQVKPEERLTAFEALEHPWVVEREGHSTAHLHQTLLNLRQFNARRRLKGSIRAVIAANRMKKILDFAKAPNSMQGPTEPDSTVLASV